MITSHYFDAVFADPQGRAIPPERFRTLQRAMLFADDQEGPVSGTIYYVDDPALPGEPVIRFVNGGPEEVSTPR